MRTLILVPVLLAAFTSAGCGGGGDDSGPVSQSADLGQEIVLRYGESADVGQLMLQFAAVTDDSRCFAGMVCVWEGNAQIQIVATDGQNSKVLELNTTLNPKLDFFDGHTIELLRLDPLPTSPKPASMTESYKATLVVDGQVTGSGS